MSSCRALTSVKSGGTQVQYLYEPQSALNLEQGVLIVPSAPWDKMRLSWLYRNLAESLAKQGYTVLRFDLTGTEDDNAPTSAMNWSTWLADAVHARDSLRGMVKRVHVVGLHLGGLIALLLGKDFAFSSVRALDPVLGPSAYLRGLQLSEQQFINAQRRYGAEFVVEHEFLGFPLGFLQELEQLRGFGPGRFRSKKLILFHSHDAPMNGPLSEELAALPVEIKSMRLDDNFAWQDPLALGQQLFCTQTVKAVCASFMEDQA